MHHLVCRDQVGTGVEPDIKVNGAELETAVKLAESKLHKIDKSDLGERLITRAILIRNFLSPSAFGSHQQQ